MEEFVVNDQDETVMKLLHFFITEKGYNPIILHGAKNEIWLENMEKNSYEIVRIITNYIHNNEQLKFDLFRTKQITKRIKKKTFSFNINVLNFFLNLGDNVEIENNKELNQDCVKINKLTDLKNYDFVLDTYPDILTLTKFKEKGEKLFMKMTNDITEKNQIESKKAEEVFSKKIPYITYGLIGINVFLFLMMYLVGNGSEDTKTLLNFGANYGPLVRLGEYYRLLTCSFLHIGIWHITFNMYALYIIGSQLESFYGKTKYLIIYLFSAIIGSLFSILFSSNISAGASGAIFGLFGSLVYFGYHYRVYLGSSIKSQIIPIIALNLGLGFLIPGIDMSAHIGGLIGGTLISMALGVKYKSTKFDKVNGFILTSIFTVFIIILAFR